MDNKEGIHKKYMYGSLHIMRKAHATKVEHAREMNCHGDVNGVRITMVLHS